jgi:8-oxo-dGTP diphosphatase
MKQIVQKVAVKAVIINGRGEVLLLRKSIDHVRHAGNSGRYNLPGGKLGPGEQIQDALKREVQEEVGLTIGDVSRRPLFVGEWHPIVDGTPMQIVGIFFVCQKWEGRIQLDAEHDEHVWVGKDEVGKYDILPPEDRAIDEYFAGF